MNGCSDGKWTQDTYYGWKSATSLPKGENIFALAHYMGVSCDWLISGITPGTGAENGKKSSLTEKYRDLLSDLETLDEAGRFAVRQLAHTLASTRSAASGTGELAG